jgi:RimJ/RimL family protein N-acetyltransferase
VREDVVIRTITPEDAEALLRLQHQLDGETKFMLLEPGERTTTVEKARENIQRVLDQTNGTILVAEHDDNLIGYLYANGGGARRNSHTVYLVIGILQAYTGQGIGTRLFEELERWAREKGLHRLELGVMTPNTAGIALYTKMGFVIEGTRKHAYRVDGEWVDEYLMGKVLD